MSNNITKDEIHWLWIIAILLGLFLISPIGLVFGFIVYLCRNINRISESEIINNLTFSLICALFVTTIYLYIFVFIGIEQYFNQYINTYKDIYLHFTRNNYSHFSEYFLHFDLKNYLANTWLFSLSYSFFIGFAVLWFKKLTEDPYKKVKAAQKQKGNNHILTHKFDK